MSTTRLPLSPATIAAFDHTERHALPPRAVNVLLQQADILRPIAEAALADALRTAFRDPPPIPRFMA